MAISLFGIELFGSKNKTQDGEEQNKSFALPNQDDGAVVIQSGSYYGTYVDLDGVVRNEVELITRYREMSIQPEMETAIAEIVNEAIVMEDSGSPVDINMDDLKEPDQIKLKIKEEFDNILKMLNFGNMGDDIFRRWYIDGRLFYHVVTDEKNLRKGVQDIRYVDPRRIRKVREIQKTRDPKTGVEIIKRQNEYYLYNERGMIGGHTNLGSKIAVDSVVNVNSSLMDARRQMVISHLHKSIKPLNQLRMMEDATVIYRLSRAPERRIFYISTAGMNRMKSEQYMKDMVTKYRNKLVYNAETGEVKDDRKHLSMLEDIWIPRRDGNKETEITTLPGGQNLGVMEDVDYFRRKMYESLGIPVSRLLPTNGFSAGRTTEITREEVKFHKFISSLRNKFSILFDDLLRIQLVLKGICTQDEWKKFKEDIWYDYKKDNNFEEFKESEILRNRAEVLGAVDPFVGKYYSINWVRKKVLNLTDEEIASMDEQIAQELSASQVMNPEEDPGAEQQDDTPPEEEVGQQSEPPPQSRFVNAGLERM